MSRSDMRFGYKPVIARVLEALQQHAEPNGTVVFSNRRLAEAVECSPGHIPDTLRELISDGAISILSEDRTYGTRAQLHLDQFVAPLSYPSIVPGRSPAAFKAPKKHIAAALEQLARLRDQGHLTEAQFQTAKAALV